MVWKETGILLDGHTRLALAEELGLPYRVREKSFANRDDALDWITLHQRARRNLTEAQDRALRGRRQLAEARGCGAPRGNSNAKNNAVDVDAIVSNSGRSKTAVRLSKELGVSPATLERDARYARELDEIAKVAPDVTKDVLAGKVDGRRAAVSHAARAAREGRDPREAIRNAPAEKPAAKRIPSQSAPVEVPTPPKRGTGRQWLQPVQAEVSAADFCARALRGRRGPHHTQLEQQALDHVWSPDWSKYVDQEKLFKSKPLRAFTPPLVRVGPRFFTLLFLLPPIWQIALLLA